MQLEAGKVLIVEDDDAIRVLLRAVLSERGYKVVECTDGAAAFGIASAEQPDVVLLDLGLPGLHGLTVLDQIKADEATQEIPVLVVTAWDDGELVARALDSGAVDYIRKPFHVAELGARVEAVARTQARHAELEGLASVDGLTGLTNRRGLDRELERLIARGQRAPQNFAAIMVDVDNFKAVNDTHGHAVGDDVLRAVAVRLRRMIRGADVVGRWGGEEFLVIAPDAEGAGAEQLAERMREAVSAKPIGDLTITVSAGVALWDERDDLRSMLARADEALYAAKMGGRDQVRVAPSPARHLRSVA